jgi:hypothetical protein
VPSGAHFDHIGVPRDGCHRNSNHSARLVAPAASGCGAVRELEDERRRGSDANELAAGPPRYGLGRRAIS